MASQQVLLLERTTVPALRTWETDVAGHGKRHPPLFLIWGLLWAATALTYTRRIRMTGQVVA